MTNKKFFILTFSSIFLCSTLFAQGGGDPTLRRIGFHTGNRAAISFYNDGQIAGFNIGTDIRGEWPIGSNENYIGDCIPLIGVQFATTNGDTLQSVTISRGPRNRQGEEKNPETGRFRGWNPIRGFLNPNAQSLAMSHLPDTWPIGGWADPGGVPEITEWVDEEGKTEWYGFFGRGIQNADQESFFVADDQSDDEFNGFFKPDANDPLRNGMGLQLRQRGFQWSSFLAEDAIFWLYDIKNEGTTTFRKANFGTVVGTLAGGDGDSGDDLGFFDAQDWITYSWDSDNSGNRGQEVGYVGYAFLESPGNPFDGIDNDGDSKDNASPRFEEADFDEIIYKAGDAVVLIDPVTYERTLHTVGSTTETVSSLGRDFVIEPGVTKFREGHIGTIQNGVSIPHPSGTDGIDNDLDGLIDENQSVHLDARLINDQDGLKYVNYVSGLGVNDPLIDEKRDNNVDEDGDWDFAIDDVGADGLGPTDDGYPGPDFGEGDGVPTQGEPNFGITDPDESDQIGLTAFNFFNINASPDMTNDSLLWARMIPGRFDVIPAQPQDGDFIYASGFFPLAAGLIERFSVSLLFGEDFNDIFSNKAIVQQIYNAGYKFPQPPKKPKINLTQEDGKVVIYWDSEASENSKDFITKKKDFQGYKIYRSTEAGFLDSRSITNAIGVLSFDKPIAQFDKIDDIEGFFYPSPQLLAQVGGTSYYLGNNSGLVNKFVDSTVVPGLTYYYAVVSYDSGEDSIDIFPSENSRFIFRNNRGEIETDDNTGYITPARRPGGYQAASTDQIEQLPGFRGTGSVQIELIDDAAIKSGYSYQIAFQDSALQGYTKSWSLIDLQTPDTVYVPLINETYVLNPTESIPLPQGTDSVFVNGKKTAVTGLVYTSSYDTLVNRSKVFSGNTPINHGFRAQINNDWVIRRDTSKTKFEGILSDPAPSFTFQPFFFSATGQGAALNGIDMPYNYRIEFSSSIVDTSVADTLFPPISSNIFPARPVNFKVKNLTTDKYIDFAYFKFGTLSTGYSIYFKENIEGVKKRTWRVDITYRQPDVPLEPQGTLTLATLKPFSRFDVLKFNMKGAEINSEMAKNDLNLIKVVPNPYVVTHQGEARLLSSQTSGRGERTIRFTHVPPGSKISIFTVRGEKIKTLYHEDIFTGDVEWNLRTEENIDAAFGVYVYVVEAEDIGTKIGKFALIK